MKTEQITLALAIAREGSVSKAAESLFISQPTASNMLKALESELGYPLFDRTRSGTVPTDEGAEFLEYAAAIQRSLDSISHISQPVKHVDFAVLSSQFDFTELAFEKLCENHLGGGHAATLSYLVEPRAKAAIKEVENGNADVAIIVQKSGFHDPAISDAERMGLEITPIGEFSLELTCNKDHPLIEGGSIAYDLFDEYTCFTSVHFSDFSYVPRLVTEYGATSHSNVIMNPCAARYRLLHDSNGFLISAPIPDEVKAEFGFDSLPVEHSSMCLLAAYRKDSHKKDLIDEYSSICRSLI